MSSVIKTKAARPETTPKIVLFDCESFPNLSYTWGTYDQNVIKVKEARLVCSISWQFYPSREKFVKALPDFPGYNPKKRDNRKLIDYFTKNALEKADVAIGHNIDAFDDPMVNTDIAKRNIDVPPPHRTIDTLRICRSRFRFNSNKLGDVCEELGIGSKVEHPGFSMWEGCMRGDPKSWALMKKYNVGDIDPLLRGLYERLLPWIRRHPNMVQDGRQGCPACRSLKVVREGWERRYSITRPRFSCGDCGHWFNGVYVHGRWQFRT